MKKVLLAMGALAVAGFAQAQITVTSDNLPVPFDAFETATDTIVDPNDIDPGTAGTDKTWDFSSLTPDVVFGTGFVDPEMTPYAADYPNATLAVEEQGQVTYFRTGTDGMYLLGVEGGFSARFEPESTLVKMPVVYNDTYQDNSAINVDFADTFTGQHDSIRYSQETDRDVTVDAWGTVQLPNKSYPALRLDITSTSVVRIYTKDSTVLGWGDWTYDPVLTQQFGGGDEEVTTSFEWYTNDNNVITTLVQMVYQPDSAEVMPEGVTYAYFPTVGIEELASADVSVYPNPATDLVTVSLETAVNGAVKVYNAEGQLVLTQTINGTQATVATSTLPAGTYFVHTIENNGAIRSVNQVQVVR